VTCGPSTRRSPGSARADEFDELRLGAVRCHLHGIHGELVPLDNPAQDHLPFDDGAQNDLPLGDST